MTGEARILGSHYKLHKKPCKSALENVKIFFDIYNVIVADWLRYQ